MIATGTTGAELLSQGNLGAAPIVPFKVKEFAAELPAPLTSGAPEIVMKTSTRWVPPLPNQQRYYGDTAGPTVLGYRLGKGEVIWWADSLPLTNYGLTQSSNLMLFLNSLRRQDVLAGSRGGRIAGQADRHDGTAREKRTRVLWDEYYHGERLGFWAYMGRTPAPWAIVQLGFLGLAALLAFGRRSGPLRSLPHESRLSPLEFVETLGSLYQHQGAARDALEISYGRFHSLLVRRLRLSESAAADEIARGVRERLGWTVPGFWETLHRSERGIKNANLNDHEALRLVQDLHDYGRRLRLEEGTRV